MSWKAEVIADNSGKWCSNQLRFETREEAANYAADLACRWVLVRKIRPTESDESVNASFRKGEVEHLKESK